MNINASSYTRILDFIKNRMRMSHIYQPAMLKLLLQSGGKASVEEIAKNLLSHDQSQIEYYEEITKNMVGKVLSDNNNITTKVKTGNRISDFEIIGFDQLSEQEVMDLISECDTKISGFIDDRGHSIWDHRKRSSGYISGTVQYEVLKRAKFRCELCGIMDSDKALQVDHIQPRSLGGSDDITNLQALCYSCNAMKGNRGNTDFRGVAESYNNRVGTCVFCELATHTDRKIIAQNALCYAVEDKFPATNKHTLIIPFRHVSDMFELYQPEINAIYSILSIVKESICKEDKSVTGFNVGVNIGESAGQTIFHCHYHLIPRRDGDVRNPRGGIRGVIPEKQTY